MLKPNKLKKILKSGKGCIGTWSIMPSASLANVMAVAGFDFVIIDMEHGPASFETAEDMVRALENESCTPLIRVPSNNDSDILRALEIGAHGVVVPQIETPQQAKNVISATKHAPIGHRGMSVFTRSSGYYAVGQKGRTDKENEETMIVLLVEGVKGINNLDKIAKIGSIDVIYIGTYDLSQSLGIPDKTDSPKIVKEVEKCIKLIRSNGIAAGVLAQTQNDIEQWLKMGVQFIPYLVDCGIYYQACLDIVNKFRTKSGVKQ
jgi:4-hydroxy-2-oxoheptanedioate aldolase